MGRKAKTGSSTPMGGAGHKRAASGGTSVVATRPKRQKATPTKSQYFEGSEKSDLDDGSDAVATSETGDEDASVFGEDAEAEDSASSAAEDEDDYDDESDDAPRSRKKRTPGTGNGSTVTTPASEEVWKPGVKTGLGPGTQVVIKKPKARPAGKTPYQDDTLHPNTLQFLQELKANNNRDWLKLHDAIFRQAEKDWHGFVEKITERLIEIDTTIPELPVKDVIFRIYRDVRFSKDPTPYKAHFSAAWSRTGRKGPYAAYYVQIGPDSSFVGGGLWHPDSAPTAAMRSDIDRHPRRLKTVLAEEGLRKEFLSDAKNDKKAVAAFVSNNAENALKSKPKGYDANHPDIALLRLRNYTIGRKLTNDEVLGPAGLTRIADLLTCMKPFVTYLNSVVMPDEEEESEESEESSGEDDGEDVE